MGAIDTAVNTGLGMVLGEVNDARQRRQQRKLQQMQIEGQMKLGEFNREQAMKMWEDTNYAAQRKQLEKAGLNIGLMYGTAGGGGTTQGAGAGNVTGAQAPSGGREMQDMIGMGLTAELQKAQIENIKANTGKTKAETPGAGQIPEQIKTGIESTKTGIEATKVGMELTKQQIENEKFKTEINKWQEQQEIINTNIADKNQHEAIKQMVSNTKELEARANQAVTQERITKESADAVIQQAKLQNVETGLRMAVAKLGMTATQEQIKKTSQEIMNMQVGLSVEQRRIRLQELATGWQFGGDASTKRNVEVTKMFVDMISGMLEAILPQ